MNNGLAGVAPFVRENYVESTVWPEGRLDNWLKWAATHGYLMLTLNNEEKVTGVLIARTVKEIPARKDLAPFDEDGNIIYIDFAIAPTLEIQKALVFAALQRYGLRPLIAFRKNAHSLDSDPEKLKLHDSRKVIKAFLNIEE